MMQSLVTKLVEVCRCLAAGPFSVLLILTIRRAEPICIKYFWGAWDYCQTIQASDGSHGDYYSRSVSINEKIMVIGAVSRDNGKAVYEFTLQGETWKEEKKLTASDAELGEFFGGSVAISGGTLLVGDPFKDGNR